MNEPTGDRLALLYRVTQTFNSSLDLDEVLSTVMDEVISVTRAERGFVMLFDSSNQLTFRIARGMDQKTLESPDFQISRSIVSRVAGDGTPLITSDAQADSRFSSRQSIVILGLRSILCVPLKIKGRSIGVIYVDNRFQTGIFTQADLDLLTAIGSSAAIAIENARLYQMAVEKGRMERELQMARKVQTGLLPEAVPVIDGWEFATRWQPAREVGGDLFDFVPYHSPDGRREKIGLVIADVTDKGMPAALFMAFARSIVRANLSHSTRPDAGITQANQLICSESTKGLYITLFYADLHLDSGMLTYVNAGHNPAILCRFDDGLPVIELLPATGMPLGIEADQRFEQQAVKLSPGELIVMYTDGVTEAPNASLNEFGLDRLCQVIHEFSDRSPQELVDIIAQQVVEYTGEVTPFDDITILIARRAKSV